MHADIIRENNLTVPMSPQPQDTLNAALTHNSVIHM